MEKDCPESHRQHLRQQAQDSNRRRFLKAVGVTGSSIVAAGCTSAFNSGGGNSSGGGGSGFANRDEIRIGLITAVDQVTGQSLIRTAKLAVNDINNSGGINGKNLSLHIGDSQMDPNQAITAYQNLTSQNNIDMLTGLWISEVGMTLMDYIADDELITVASAFGSPEANVRVKKNYEKYKYFFRTQIHTYQMARWSKDYLSQYLFQNFDIDRFGLLVEDALWAGPYGKELKSFIKDTTGVKLAYYAKPSTDTSQFGPILRDAANANVDVLYPIFSHLPGTTFFKPWRQNKYDFLVDGYINTSNQYSYWKNTNGQARYAASKYLQGFSSKVPDKTRSYLEQQPEQAPPAPFWQSYDAVAIYAKALRSAQTLNSDELVDELENTTLKGVGGISEFLGKDQDYPHNVKLGTDYIYPREVQWQKVQENHPITGGGLEYTIWPNYEDFALVDNVNNLDLGRLPAVAKNDYAVPSWISKF
jgi:branched-chain amino acid transport system substrate-binding protein